MEKPTTSIVSVRDDEVLRIELRLWWLSGCMDKVKVGMTAVWDVG